MIKKLSAVCALALLLAACAGEPPLPPVPVSLALMPKIALDVQTINLADRSGLQPAGSPYNSNHFTPTIDDAIKQWASDRLQANGTTGQAIVVIKNASLTAQPLATQSGIDMMFTRQQALKYVARAEVSIEASGRPGFAVTDAVATRAVTLPEDPTPTEKQDAYYSLLNGLMKDLGQNLESGIQSHMGNFIVAPQSYGATAVPTSSSAPAPYDNNTPSIVVEQPDMPPAAPVIDGAGASLASSPASFAPSQAVTIPLSGSLPR